MVKKRLSSHVLETSPLKKIPRHEWPHDLNMTSEFHSLISPNLYLGGYETAYDGKALSKLRIKGILNCTKNLNNQHPNHFEYLRIPVDDSLEIRDIRRMARLLPLAAEYIHKYVDVLKQPVYVHCAQGRQRSVACVVAYLMRYKGMTPERACEYVMKKRPEAFRYGTSLNFSQSINAYYKTINNK